MLRLPFLDIAPSQDQVRRTLLACLAVGFASLVFAMLAAGWLTKRSQEHGASVTHTYDVEQAIAALRLPIWRSEAARRGYLITPNPTALRVYRDMASSMMPALDRVASLTRDNPRQQPRVARLRALLRDLTTLREQSVSAVRDATITEAMRAESIDASIPMLAAITVEAEALVGEEQRLLAIRAARERESLEAFYVVLGGTAMLLAIVGVLTALTLTRYTRDLTQSRDQLRDLADSLEDTVRERTADLSRANDEIQRFAYIVSHDLRAPLVNVLGFTGELESATNVLGDFVDQAEAQAPQLLTQEARMAAREDLPEAIGFIRSSTQKMDRLINAILKLSREGGRVLTPERIDLAAMLGDIRASLHHRTEALGATIDLVLPMPNIVSDRLACEQIFSNIIENAVKYLSPDRPGLIEVGAGQSGDRVIVDIRDNGRGIDPRDHQRIFDLFRRSGAQDQVGEGIGLAHVRALVYRLGGTISVDSMLEQGSTFRVNLPALLAKTGSAPS